MKSKKYTQRWQNPEMFLRAKYAVATHHLHWAGHPEEIEICSIKIYADETGVKVCARYRGEIYRCKIDVYQLFRFG